MQTQKYQMPKKCKGIAFNYFSWYELRYNPSTPESNSPTPQSSHILSNQFRSGLVYTKLSTRVGITGHFD